MIKALKGAVKDAADILSIILSGIIGRVFYADKDFFNGIEGILIMFFFNSML